MYLGFLVPQMTIQVWYLKYFVPQMTIQIWYLKVFVPQMASKYIAPQMFCTSNDQTRPRPDLIQTNTRPGPDQDQTRLRPTPDQELELVQVLQTGP